MHLAKRKNQPVKDDFNTKKCQQASKEEIWQILNDTDR